MITKYIVRCTAGIRALCETLNCVGICIFYLFIHAILFKFIYVCSVCFVDVVFVVVSFWNKIDTKNKNC